MSCVCVLLLFNKWAEHGDYTLIWQQLWPGKPLMTYKTDFFNYHLLRGCPLDDPLTFQHSYTISFLRQAREHDSWNVFHTNGIKSQLVVGC